MLDAETSKALWHGQVLPRIESLLKLPFCRGRLVIDKEKADMYFEIEGNAFFHSVRACKEGSKIVISCFDGPQQREEAKLVIPALIGYGKAFGEIELLCRYKGYRRFIGMLSQGSGRLLAGPIA